MAFWSKDSLAETTSAVQKEPQSAPAARQPETKPEPAEAPVGRFDKVRSALGPGTVIQGKLSFDTAVRIDGKLSGEVFSTDSLIVGPSGSIDAQIDAKHLVVMGVVRGTIKVSGKIELLAGGRIESDINTPILVMEPGSIFNGKCAMNTKEASAIKSAELHIPIKEATKTADGSVVTPDAAKDDSKSSELRVH